MKKKRIEERKGQKKSGRRKNPEEADTHKEKGLINYVREKNGQSMPEYARVCQSMPEYARVCKSMQEYARVCQSMPEYARVCNSMPEYAKVCKSMPEYARV